MTSIFFGLLTVALASATIFHWWGDGWLILKGLLPFSFICGGLIAIIAGISSLKK